MSGNDPEQEPASAGRTSHRGWRLWRVLLLGLAFSVALRTAGANDLGVAQTDVLARSLVISPFRITEGLVKRKLRFVLSRADGEPLQIVATAEQSYQRVDGKVVLTVCADCGDELSSTEQQASLYLLPNAWVQSQDPLVHGLAARAGGPDDSVDMRMRRLARIVEHRLRGVVDDKAYDDALRALKQQHGDCTEFALALAALARAQGIPTRIVFGMAYASRFTGRKDVFAPHAWVQAWDAGNWRSYDAALGGFDSTHIALAIGNGEPAEASKIFAQFPQLRIERIGVIAR